MPDPTWSQNVKAILVLEPGCSLTLADIQDHCRERIASFKKPKLAEFVPEIPRLNGAKDYPTIDATFARRQLSRHPDRDLGPTDDAIHQFERRYECSDIRSSAILAPAPRDHSQQCWDSEVQLMDVEQLTALRLTRCRSTIDRALTRPVPHFQRKLANAGIGSGNDLERLEQLQAVAMTTKDELRASETAHPPVGDYRFFDLHDTARLGTSGGTTGQPTHILWTQHDIWVDNDTAARTYWRRGLRPGAIVTQASRRTSIPAGSSSKAPTSTSAACACGYRHRTRTKPPRLASGCGSGSRPTFRSTCSPSGDSRKSRRRWA